MVNACVMLASFGVGDHWLFVIEFQLQSFLGANPTQGSMDGNTEVEHDDSTVARSMSGGLKVTMWSIS